MFGLNYLMMVGIASIIGAIVSILIGLVLSTLTSLSPLIIGGIVGGISVVPLIAALITTPPSAGPHNRNMSDSLKVIMFLGGLFTGSIITGIGLVAYGVTPITKVDSLLFLSTTANSLLSIGVIALLFPIVAAIGIGIAIKLAGAVKKYISNKQTKPPEEEPRCMVPGCDGMIKYEKKIPSKEELWDKYYMGAPEQQRQFVEQYKIVKRA